MRVGMSQAVYVCYHYSGVVADTRGAMATTLHQQLITLVYESYDYSVLQQAGSFCENLL